MLRPILGPLWLLALGVYYNVQPSWFQMHRVGGHQGQKWTSCGTSTEDLLHIWQINSILNVKVIAPSQRPYGLQDLVCHGTTRTVHKAKRLRRKAERTWTTFLAAVQKMWNSLPVNIRNEENFHTFKTLLKTYFLN